MDHFFTRWSGARAGVKRGAGLLVLSALALAACGPAADAGRPGPASNGQEASAIFSAPADPLNVALKLANASVTQAIGPEGGTVEVAAPDGRVHRVIFEPDTFLVETEITATAVRGASGMPDGTAIETGLQLEPHGLSLARPATVSLELPQDVDLAAYGVFSTLANGEQVYPTLGLAQDGRVDMQIVTFSSYNGGESSAEAEAQMREKNAVTSAGRRAYAEIQAILRETAEGQLAGEMTEAVSESERIAVLLKMWWQEGILPLAEQAQTDDVALMKLSYEGLNLVALIQRLGMSDGTLYTELVDLMAGPLSNAYDRSLQRCKQEHRLGEARYLLGLEAQMQLLGTAETSTVFVDIAKCMRFRLAFESTITQEGRSEATSNTQTLFVRGEVDDLGIPAIEQLVDGSTGVASGDLDYITAQGRSVLSGISGECVADTVGGEGSSMDAFLADIQGRPQLYGPWSVPEIYGEVDQPEDPEPGMTVVLLDPGEPREQLSGDCVGMSAGDTSDLWDHTFWIRHLGQALPEEEWAIFLGSGSVSGELPPEDTGFHFELKLEDPPGRIYASYELPDADRCNVFDDDFGSGENCERTFITLYHEPED